MALAIPPHSDRKRVKVYELKNNDWFDRGTGFCLALSVNVRARLIGSLWKLATLGGGFLEQHIDVRC